MSFVKYQAKPPTSKIDEINYSPRLSRIKRAVERLGFSFELDRDDPESHKEQIRRNNEILTMRYKQQYPNDVFKVIGWIHRYYLPKPGMFEFEDGTLDMNHEVKQALVYYLHEYVDNPNLEDGPIGYQTKMGLFQVPIARNRRVRDSEGLETIELEQVGTKNIFYIPYTPENVDKILSEMYNTPDPRNFGVGYARERGPDTRDQVYTVFNIQEFKEIQDIEGLMDASKGNWLQNEYGGYNEFVKEKDKARTKPIRKRDS